MERADRGVTQESECGRVTRNERGRVVGGAQAADDGPTRPVSIDVAVDPAHREVWARRLYAEFERRGIDIDPFERLARARHDDTRRLPLHAGEAAEARRGRRGEDRGDREQLSSLWADGSTTNR